METVKEYMFKALLGYLLFMGVAAPAIIYEQYSINKTEIIRETNKSLACSRNITEGLYFIKGNKRD